jgi:hypothetical protein
MPTESANDGALDELLPLARVSTEATAARRWLEDALIAARGTVKPQLAAAGATRAPKKPPPAKHNAPLKKIERTAAQLIAALEQLRRHPYAHGSFWRFKAFGPVYASGFERAGVMPTLTNVREAARKAQIRRTGRPRNVRKQHIVDLALAFCARFSPDTPSSDVNNFFPRFAKRFFEHAIGLSVDDKGCGIDRQIRVAIRRLPIEMERAKLLSAQLGG